MIAASVVEAVHDEGEGLGTFDANVDGFAKNLVAALGWTCGEDLFAVDQDFHFQLSAVAIIRAWENVEVCILSAEWKGEFGVGVYTDASFVGDAVDGDLSAAPGLVVADVGKALDLGCHFFG